ncbi:MAG: endonuclease/exonuclease/phosphatase family protein [Alistipes sp.]|jgi:endonuclease/exonuclease/phosphatase family metal-dependent hydrolase|nr:endonuclease/exonuclease/phosphatase family protein [Alistipes sp.]
MLLRNSHRQRRLTTTLTAKIALLFLLSVLGLQPSGAQRTSIAFWNVENLFDTIPSPFYDDSEFTPHGSGRWNTEKYNTKIENLARVVDELAADIVGLAEVENEAVVRDLVRALETDYNYIHLTSGDSRGIDQALLYKGDRFFPDPDPADSLKPAARLLPSGMGREFLHVRGELCGERVDLIVCHMASNLNSTLWRRRNMESLRTALENILKNDPAANVIVMGDMNAVPDEKLVERTLGPLSSAWDFMYTPHLQNLAAGQGSYSYRGRWYLYDWMMVSPAIARGTTLGVADAGIYAREYLISRGPGAGGSPSVDAPARPFRTFYGGDYLGGFSDHFPVWMVISK